MKFKIKKSHLAILPIAIVFAIGILLFISAYAKKDALSTFTLWGSKETTIESQNTDTDNDGLKDWEENLYKTDPLNPDTDGDGYLDGEEINSGHNPTVKGPNDKQAFYPLPLGDKYNITEKIFADFDAVLKSYIKQKDAYARDHPEITSAEEYLAKTSQSTINEMLKRALLYNENDWAERANAILDQMPEIFDIEISDNSINISNDNNTEAIKNYFAQLSSFIKSGSFLFQNKNLELLKTCYTNNDFIQIDDLIILQDEEIARFLQIPIPDSWKEIHKQALKIAITTRNIFISIRGAETDPIRAVIAANKSKDVKALWESFSQNIINLSQSQKLNLEI
jgi:hypothetical protein